MHLGNENKMELSNKLDDLKSQLSTNNTLSRDKENSSNNTVMRERGDLNSTVLTNTTNIRDANVNKNIERFYKMQNEIEKSIKE